MLPPSGFHFHMRLFFPKIIFSDKSFDKTQALRYRVFIIKGKTDNEPEIDRSTILRLVI